MKDLTNLICRAKRKDNGEWVEGYYFPYQDMHFMFPTEAKDSNHFYLMDYAIEVDHETVGRYTGLTDKNGKKIFEGDIVKVRDAYKHGGAKNHEFTGKVEFDNASFMINQVDFIKHYRWIDYEVEIIGNIYDTPELLEGDE